jgi:tRNA-dihydrouridine synthase
VDQRGDERYSTLQMKKFVSWFSHGFPHSQSFRKGLFTLKSSGDILNFAEEYFSHLKAQDQLDTSSEAFLMGGHG